MATEKNTNAKISKSNALFRGVFFVLVVDIVQQIVGNLFANCLQAYLYFGAFLHTVLYAHTSVLQRIFKNFHNGAQFLSL